MPSSLLRIKAMIWVHAGLGPALAWVFFRALSAQDEARALVVLGCGLAWMVGIGPLQKHAGRLRLEDKVASRGLPELAIFFWGIGEFVSLTWWATPWGTLLVPVHLLIGAVLFLRGALSLLLDVPIHRRTWHAGLVNLTLGLVLHSIAWFLHDAIPRIMASC
jgi:hypothetical protein